MFGSLDSVSRDADPSLKRFRSLPPGAAAVDSVSRDADPSLKPIDSRLSLIASSLFGQ